MATEKVPKSSKLYECIKCNFTTVRKSQFDRHILTRKHNNQQKCRRDKNNTQFEYGYRLHEQN